MAAIADSVQQRTGVILTTTDGAVTNAASFQTASNTAYLIECYVLGAEQGTGNFAGSAVLAGTFQNVAGTLTQVSTTTSEHSKFSSGTPMNAALTTSGTQIIVQVTGNPGSTIKWRIDCVIYPLDKIGP